MKVVIVSAWVVAAALSAEAGVAQPRNQQSPLVQALANCRSQADDAARLRCYDAAAGALTDATAKGSVVLVDQEDVRKTRRSLFGFSLPNLPFFSGDKTADEAQEELTAKIASAGPAGYGKWRLRLEDGAVWETTESSATLRDPRVGNEVVIRRGPLGSYMVRIAGQRALRVKRVG
jgi:hypothetical protein